MGIRSTASRWRPARLTAGSEKTILLAKKSSHGWFAVTLILLLAYQFYACVPARPHQVFI